MYSQNAAQTGELIGFPLSPQQQRVFFHDAAMAGFPYITEAAITVTGAVDVERLEQALAAAVQRHEILRTRFTSYDDAKSLLQVVRPESEMPRRQPLTASHLTDRSTWKHERFDLSEGKTLHCKLVQNSPEESTLFISFPSICGDAASVRNIVHDLALAYESYEHLSSREKPAQYADVAAYFNNRLESDAGALGRQYWFPRLTAGKAPEIRGCPARQGGKSLDPQCVHGSIPAELLANAQIALNADSSFNGPFLLTCWQALLQQISGENEFVVGYALDGRELPQLENSVGLFERYLPLQMSSAQETLFSAALAKNQESIGEAVRWQGSFQWPSHEKFHAVCFSYYDGEWTFRGNGVNFACASVNSCSDIFELKLSCTTVESAILLDLWYDAGVYLKREAEQLLHQFITLARNAASAPHAPILRLNAINEQERHRLIAEYSPASHNPAEKSLLERIEEQARHNPGNIAAVCGKEQLTYGDLDRKANLLAHYLRGLGVRPDVVVGICMERSLELMIAILGTMKAGGAYMPMDPSYPPDRLRYMLQDAHPLLVLTQEPFRKHFSGTEVALLCLDSQWQAVAEQSERAPIDAAPEDALAYVIYTSGSTGRPKGVAITRSGLNNYVTWACVAYGFASGARAPLCSSLSFDLSVTSLWPPLATGGCVVLAPGMDGIEWLVSEGRSTEPYDVLKITPAHLQVLRHFPEQGINISRTFVIGGEALRWDEVQDWRGHLATTRLINEYGPTETVVGSCVHSLNEAWNEKGSVPVGKPIANTKIYVLNQWGELAPAGAIGELYIGGAGVARGYLNRPALTADRFVPDTFSGEPGARLYRTGDTARWRADGTLEFLGRVDEQVKLNGFRIEPGEIESVLAEFAGIQQARVVVREDAPGEKRLVAYVIVHSNQKEMEDEVREFLRARLPDYMVPRAVMQLPRLPLTPNGKLDRRLLPAPEVEAPRKTYAEPRTENEKILGRIWAQVLGLQQVGRDDNFFELGGDSILSIQVVARAREAGLHLTTRQMFEWQTIAELAEVAVSPTGVNLSEQGAVHGPVPLTPIQAAFFQWELVRPELVNHAIIFELPEDVDSGHMKEAVLAVVKHHDALRSRFANVNGEWTQHTEAEIQESLYEYRDLSGHGAEQAVHELELDAKRTRTSLNLQTGPLIKAVEYDLGPGCPKRLMLLVHHLVVDGVSWRILLEDLQRAYEQLSRGGTVSLGSKTTSYKQWAERIHKYSETEELRAEVEYWCNEEREDVHPLLRDFNQAVEDNRLENKKFIEGALSQADTQALLQDVPAAYHVQIQEVLLAALGHVCAEWAGSETVLVDVEGHGREEVFDGIDLSRTVGWFTAIYPVLLSRGKNGEWESGSLLQKVKQQLQEIPRRGFGYGVLRCIAKDAEIAARLRRMPKAEISFNYLGQFDHIVRESKLFKPARESAGLSTAWENPRLHLLEVEGVVMQSRLHVSWSFNRKLHREETIQKLADRYLQCLRELLAQCQQQEYRAQAAAFPLTGLSEKELMRVAAQINK